MPHGFMLNNKTVCHGFMIFDLYSIS